MIDAVRAALAAHADPARAGPMQAYMKSLLPFYGIATPLRRQLVGAVVHAHPAPDRPALAATMRQLWRTARFREERYAALELARIGPHRALFGAELLPLYEEMISSGAWWDYCDDISGNAVGRLLQCDTRTMKTRLRRWALGPDLWLRRAAMLGQRSLPPADFDAVLFYDTILPSVGGGAMASEFFIRKGMGWALRERAYAAPEEVAAFCREYEDRLSPLTRREALKHIARQARTPGA